MTGFSQAAPQAKLKAAGVAELLLKPMTASDLARTVRRALGGDSG